MFQFGRDYQLCVDTLLLHNVIVIRYIRSFFLQHFGKTVIEDKPNECWQISQFCVVGYLQKKLDWQYISRQSLLLNFFPLRISIIAKRYIAHWSCYVYCSGHKMFETTLLRYSWKGRRLEAILTINNQLYILSISFQKRAIRFNTQIFSIKQNNIANWCKIRLHSSRMRTARALSVSPSMLCTQRCLVLGGITHACENITLPQLRCGR